LSIHATTGKGWKLDRRAEQPVAAIYARTAVENRAALDRQIARARAAADALGLSVEFVYVDDGVPGDVLDAKDAPGRAALLDVLDKVDIVLVSDLDRLSRDVVMLPSLIAMFEREDVAIYLTGSDRLFDPATARLRAAVDARGKELAARFPFMTTRGGR